MHTQTHRHTHSYTCSNFHSCRHFTPSRCADVSFHITALPAVAALLATSVAVVARCCCCCCPRRTHHVKIEIFHCSLQQLRKSKPSGQMCSAYVLCLFLFLLLRLFLHLHLRLCIRLRFCLRQTDCGLCSVYVHNVLLMAYQVATSTKW